MTIILYSLVFFALLGGEVFRLQFPNSVAILLLDGAVFLLVISSYLRLAVTKKWQITRTLFVPFLLFVLAALLSLGIHIGKLSPEHLGIASLYLVRFVVYMSVLFIVAHESQSTQKLIVTLSLIAGGLFVVAGYLQYFFYPALRNLYYLGWDEHLYRLFSTFLDPNFAGVFLVLYVFFLLFLLRSQKSYRSIRSRLLFIGICLTLLAVVLTFSRSALIMLGVTSVLYLFIIDRKKYITGVFVSALLLFIILLPFSHIENTDLLRTASTQARLDSAKIALTIFSKNPVFGVGFNAYRYAQVQYGFRKPQTKFPSHANSGTDNSFLFLLATTGVVGTAAFGFFIYRLCLVSWQTYRTKQSSYSLLFLLSLVGICADSLFINSLFYPPILVWLGVIGGLMIRDSL